VNSVWDEQNPASFLEGGSGAVCSAVLSYWCRFSGFCLAFFVASVPWHSRSDAVYLQYEIIKTALEHFFLFPSPKRNQPSPEFSLGTKKGVF
jgi:hypothetical protein